MSIIDYQLPKVISTSTSDVTESNDETVIDLLTTTEFTENHLKVVKEMYGPVDHNNPKDFGGWPKVYPELYGNKLPPQLKFVGWEILEKQNSTNKTKSYSLLLFFNFCMTTDLIKNMAKISVREIKKGMQSKSIQDRVNRGLALAKKYNVNETERA